MSNINQVDVSEFRNYTPTEDEQSLYGVVYSNEDAVYVHPELFHTVEEAYEYIRVELEQAHNSRMYMTVADAVASVSLRGAFTYRHCVNQNGREPIVVWHILDMYTNKQMVAEEDRQSFRCRCALPEPITIDVNSSIDLCEGAL